MVCLIQKFYSKYILHMSKIETILNKVFKVAMYRLVIMKHGNDYSLYSVERNQEKNYLANVENITAKGFTCYNYEMGKRASVYYTFKEVEILISNTN